MGTMVTGAIVSIWQSALNVGWDYWVVTGVPVFILFAFVGQYFSFKKRKNRILLQGLLIKNSDTDAESGVNIPIEAIQSLSSRISNLENLQPRGMSEDTYTGMIQMIWDSVSSNIDTKLNELTENQNRGIDALFANKKTSDVMKFAQLAEILDAKNHLERFDEVSTEIDEAVKHLDKIPLCENWSGRHQYFKGRLNEWDSFSNHYNIPEYKPLFEVKPNELKSANWDALVNKLSTDEGIEYKHYRLALQAYRENYKPMRGRISYIAKKSFYGRSAKGSYMERFER